MEATIFMATCQRRRLCTVIDDCEAADLDTRGMDAPSVRTHLSQLREVYSDTLESSKRGTLYTDVLSPETELGARNFAAQIVDKPRTPVPAHWNEQVNRLLGVEGPSARIPRAVVYLRDLRLRGAVYSDYQPNCYVALSDPDSEPRAHWRGWRAARVVKIFVVPAGTGKHAIARGFAVVRSYERLFGDDIAKDHYRRYRAGGRLFYQVEEEVERVINIDDILGNCTRIDQDSMGTSRPVFQSKALFRVRTMRLHMFSELTLLYPYY